MFQKLGAFCTWFAAAGIAVHWGLALASVPPSASEGTTPVAAVPDDGLAVRRLLGAGKAPASAPVASYRLLGVIAPADGDTAGAASLDSGRGVALIAVVGQPPRPYRVGARLPDGNVLLRVSRKSAVLARDGSEATLQLAGSPSAGE